MNGISTLRQLALTLMLSLATAVAVAQTEPAMPGAYAPEVGQAGKDVVWVPTSQALVDRMLDMARATPEDFLVDLGSGDGRTVITAAKRGIKALGIEYNRDMVELSKQNAEKEGVSARAQFKHADLFQTDFSGASVITMFLLPEINLRLRPIILDMKPGTRIVSNTFSMGDWEADQTSTVPVPSEQYRTALLWIVPAKVEGTWKSAQGELSIQQTFQKFAGITRQGKVAASIMHGKLRGEQISFTAGGAEYSGRVNGNTIEGTIKANGKSVKWLASRSG